MTTLTAVCLKSTFPDYFTLDKSINIKVTKLGLKIKGYYLA
jgi:hypothetical protein